MTIICINEFEFDFCLTLGHQYWRFDEDEMQVELDYPRDMSMWSGIGYNIDSAFQYKDGLLIIFYFLYLEIFDNVLNFFCRI